MLKESRGSLLLALLFINALAVLQRLVIIAAYEQTKRPFRLPGQKEQAGAAEPRANDALSALALPKQQAPQGQTTRSNCGSAAAEGRAAAAEGRAAQEQQPRFFRT